ncbi:aldehyde dehydrogenase family protein [Candidatus Microgenomates bacterium]|nr:aldehyde dehydrogenase family protein [Candidatus Microgenomates bacterium]
MADFFSEIKEGKNYKFLVNGQWQFSKSGKSTEIRSPIDGNELGQIPSVSQEEAELAIVAARDAQKGWENTLIHERVEIILRAAKILGEQKDYLTDLLISEIGKPRKEAEDEVLRTVDLINYYAEEGRRLTGETLSSDAFPGYKKVKLAIAERVPLGVVLAIPPFNYPINEGAPKICAALVVGNSLVVKAPTQGGISTLHLAYVFQKAGLPPGVLNLVTGRGEEIGDFLVSHPQVNAINLTGSYKTASHVAQLAGVKKLIFGLSGKDASIVLADANLDLAAKEIAAGSFSYAGQRCTGIKRVLVEAKVATEFAWRLGEIVKEKFILDDPRKENVTLGPMINDQTADYVQELIDDALLKGATIFCGGKRDGRYLEATILIKVAPNMRIAWEEPFGPVLPIIEVKDWKEAVEIANQSEYGLQSSVFTQDIDKAFAVARELEVGTVQVNGKDARGPDHFPFIGVKRSGLGMVQGAKYLLSEMTRIKTIVVNTR